uniref:Uncharacterized protein n=1 Tax=Rhizophagus irregularis (strain DAOM 181602 / DAOM 197198 / MUCL 43194) TaxID=747089 RepID=U9TQ43_RHIID
MLCRSKVVKHRFTSTIQHLQKLGNADFTLNSSSSLEGGYQHNIWSPIIGPVFRNLEIDLIRGSLKLSKMFREMLVQLATECENNEQIVRKLRTIRILHSANRFKLLTMDIPKGRKISIPYTLHLCDMRVR